MTSAEWSYVRKHAWRFRGGEKWSREMTPLQVFVAQSNASGLPRLLGLALVLTADALYECVSAPLLRRGMKGPRLGREAKPLSVTALAWRVSGITNSWRWSLLKHANRLARYNR